MHAERTFCKWALKCNEDRISIEKKVVSNSNQLLVGYGGGMAICELCAQEEVIFFLRAISYFVPFDCMESRC